jgi:hypothetical protein
LDFHRIFAMKPHARACLHASRARGTGARRHACTRAHASRTCTRTHVRTRTRTRERLDITRDKRTGNRDNRTGAQPQHNTSHHNTTNRNTSQPNLSHQHQYLYPHPTLPIPLRGPISPSIHYRQLPTSASLKKRMSPTGHLDFFLPPSRAIVLSTTYKSQDSVFSHFLKLFPRRKYIRKVSGFDEK